MTFRHGNILYTKCRFIGQDCGIESIKRFLNREKIIRDGITKTSTIHLTTTNPIDGHSLVGKGTIEQNQITIYTDMHPTLRNSGGLTVEKRILRHKITVLVNSA